jgi:hypothetical protein
MSVYNQKFVIQSSLQVRLSSGNDSAEVLLVFTLNILQSEDGGSLLVDDGAQTRLRLDNNVRDAHLAAESRKEDNKLNGVDIIGNNDKGSLLSLDEGNAVVQAIFDKEWLLGVLTQKSKRVCPASTISFYLLFGVLVLCHSVSNGGEASLLFLFGLRSVLI